MSGRKNAVFEGSFSGEDFGKQPLALPHRYA